MSDHSSGVGWLLGGIAVAAAVALVAAGVLIGWWLL